MKTSFHREVPANLHSNHRLTFIPPRYKFRTKERLRGGGRQDGGGGGEGEEREREKRKGRRGKRERVGKGVRGGEQEERLVGGGGAGLSLIHISEPTRPP